MVAKEVRMLPDKIKVNFTFNPKLLLVSPVAVLLAVGMFYLPWGAERAPAWVQAVGSVAAILVAVWLSERQSAHRIHEARQNRKDQALKVLAIARLVVPRFKTSCLVYKGAPQIVLQRVAQAVKEDAALLRKFDLALIPTSAITDVWLELITCFFAGEDDLAKLAGIIPADGIERQGLQAAEKTVQDIYNRLEELVRAYDG
jgi:hypothetical protein